MSSYRAVRGHQKRADMSSLLTLFLDDDDLPYLLKTKDVVPELMKEITRTLPERWRDTATKWCKQQLQYCAALVKNGPIIELGRDVTSRRLKEERSTILQTLHLLGEMEKFADENPEFTDEEFCERLSNAINGISNCLYVNGNCEVQCGIRQTGGCGHDVVAISLGLVEAPWTHVDAVEYDENFINSRKRRRMFNDSLMEQIAQDPEVVVSDSKARRHVFWEEMKEKYPRSIFNFYPCDKKEEHLVQVFKAVGVEFKLDSY